MAELLDLIDELAGVMFVVLAALVEVGPRSRKVVWSWRGCQAVTSTAWETARRARLLPRGG
ncbi:hypothetical protein BMG523Draft_00764 [Frankia sp. BMG5.23]|nr:hypothetical protein BMG523Draft_00764 [Frankia sp. BMG5.23]